MNIVIGSGPAATSATVALVSRGLEVSVIDPGITLEKTGRDIRQRLASTEPEQWDAADIRRMKESMQPTTSGIPVKTVFGSDFIFNDTAARTRLQFVNAKMTRSYSVGGLSNVWGASVLPYPAGEIDDWPITLSELEPHYRAVLSFMPHCGRHDNLSERYPIYSDELHSLRLNSQAQALLDDMERHSAELNDADIHFGASRLALRAGTADRQNCRYCGMCLYGCPYDLIYSSATTIEQLAAEQKITHLTGYVVERLEERGNEVIIHARDRTDSGTVEFHAARVFLGAGIIESTRIMLESLGAYDRPVGARHSDRFTLPFLRYRAAAGIMQEDINTLCQLFLEISDPALADESIHLQLYTYNDLYLKALERKLGFLRSLARLPLRAFLGRLIVMFGYLHSNASSSLSMELKNSGDRRLVITGYPSRQAQAIARKVAGKLRRNRKSLRGIATLPFLDPPGGGNHSCGTFGMSDKPGAFQSDRLGIPNGFSRVHLVDSSVLPSIAGSTITLSVMANAHRIASTFETLPQESE